MDTKREFIKFLEDLTQYIDMEMWERYTQSPDGLAEELARLQEKIDSKREELKEGDND
ncbi:MAG: hypothetical protein ACTSQ8_26380 [Candidatus Helarchaeota archaeon]